MDTIKLDLIKRMTNLINCKQNFYLNLCTNYDWYMSLCELFSEIILSWDQILELIYMLSW